jgi:hypothetical protein
MTYKASCIRALQLGCTLTNRTGTSVTLNLLGNQVHTGHISASHKNYKPYCFSNPQFWSVSPETPVHLRLLHSTEEFFYRLF